MTTPAQFSTITGETWKRSLIAARKRFAGTTERIRSQIPANHLMPTTTQPALYSGEIPASEVIAQLTERIAQLESERDNWRVSSVAREAVARAEAAEADTARLDWLDAHPLQASLHGGKEDGGTAKAWAVAGHQSLTLRQTIDGIRKAHA